MVAITVCVTVTPDPDHDEHNDEGDEDCDLEPQVRAEVLVPESHQELSMALSSLYLVSSDKPPPPRTARLGRRGGR